MKKVIIVGSKNYSGKNNPEELARALVGKNDAEVVYWEDIIFSITTNAVTVYSDAGRIFDTADLVIAVGWYRSGKQSVYRDVALSLALYLESKKIEFWNSEMLEQRSTTKLSCMVKLALSGICVPETQFCLTPLKLIESWPEVPCVIKAISGSRGRENYLVKNKEELLRYAKAESAYMIQPYLANSHDLRVICFAGSPELILRRSRSSMDTHLNNTSQGGEASWIDSDSVPTMLLTESEKICIIMNRQLAGIDFIPDSSSPYGYSCLEVNAIPQLTSGYDVTTKMKKLSESIEE